MYCFCRLQHEPGGLPFWAIKVWRRYLQKFQIVQKYVVKNVSNQKFYQKQTFRKESVVERVLAREEKKWKHMKRENNILKKNYD